MNGHLLVVDRLSVGFRTGAPTTPALDDVSFSMARGEILAVVGESGAGKTSLGLALMRLLPAAAWWQGRALWDGRDLLQMEERELRQVRGGKIGMVFQDPRSSLHPFLSIGAQMTEVTRRHLGCRKREALEHAVRMLVKVGIPEARQRLSAYPREFSGGMRQRILLAMALSANPTLLIADEVTSAVDGETQALILDLLGEWHAETGGAILLITHDLALAAHLASRGMVLCGGRVMETAPMDELLHAPACAYTRVLGSLTAGAFEPRRAQRRTRGPVLTGCAFAGQCPQAEARCFHQMPPLRLVGDSHWVRCWVK